MDKRVEFQSMRKKVRNELNQECVNCGSKEGLHVHHIVPLSLGGSNRTSNLTMLCEGCHGIVHGLNFKNHSKATKAGLERARARGKKGGKPQAPQEQIDRAVQLYEEMKLTIAEITKETGVSKTSIYKYVKLKREESGGDRKCS